MAFLDNSGDIILDAVLTDTGRKRMAQGTFNIKKFALGDDEIDYSLYNKNAVNSAYYDLNILQTPILESFTNNMSSLKSKLISISRTDFLYLPILKLYNLQNFENAQPNSTIGMHLVAVDTDTENTLSTLNANGVIKGFNVNNNNRFIRIDQGTDSVAEPGAGQALEQELLETSYIIEIDNKLGNIIATDRVTKPPLSYIDDDDIASYFIQEGQQGNFVMAIPLKPVVGDLTADVGTTVLQGRRGTMLAFALQSNSDLAANDYLFNKLGSTFVLNSTTFKFIDTIVRVTGVSTGYRIDIPVRFVKE